MKLASYAALLVGATLLACSADSSSEADSDLTSLTGIEKTLTFEGFVDLPEAASDAEILRAVKQQTQSAFGATRTANIGVADRELKNVDPATFRRQSLTVVDADGKPTGKTILRVAYRYASTAIVAKTIAARSSMALGLLVGNYQASADRVLAECTENSSHDRDFRDSLWYVFNPSLESCRTAMGKEQRAIDDARARIAEHDVVSESELGRLYLPITVQLAPTGEAPRTTYPEYDRLFAGGVKPGHLVIGFVAGPAADWAAGEKVEPIDDNRFPIWLETIDQLFQARPGFALTKVEPAEDLTTADFVRLLDHNAGRKRLDRATLETIGHKAILHWLTFDLQVDVSIDGGPPKPFTIELQTYLGAGSEQTHYKRAIKTSDVFLYAGHSYIGYGPLDPKNFRPEDFPSSYQLFFVNGCVSFNYYDRDYFAIKPGGSAMLDTITNGVETLQYGSGRGMGRFLAALVSGHGDSYASLLETAQFDYAVGDWGRDGLRVVDGELDNSFDPTRTKIVVR